MSRDYASHPSDPISRSAAHDTTHLGLTTRYEDILRRDHSYGIEYAYGELQVLASLAIARVALLEAHPHEDLERALDRRAYSRIAESQEERARQAVRPLGNVGEVVPIRKNKMAPAPSTDRPGA